MVKGGLLSAKDFLVKKNDEMFFFANILSGILGVCVHMVLSTNPLEYKICEKCYRLHPKTMLFFNSTALDFYFCVNNI